MQFVSTKQDERRRSAAVSRKGTRLSMYGTPPEEEVTLEEFEGVAIDRLRGATERTAGQRRLAAVAAAAGVRCVCTAPLAAAGAHAARHARPHAAGLRSKG
jgi:hypothetical protein